MSTSSAFYPCAGLGTRMGEAGKTLPKPLWPIFETTLLDLQIEYAQSLGFSQHIINTHHLSEKISRHLKTSSVSIQEFNESKLLGSGGCFHNLKSQGVTGSVFIFNPDSFFLMSERDSKSFLSIASQIDQVLIAVPCKAEDHYNRLVIKDDVLQAIVPPDEKAPLLTYSGFGKVSLDSLSLVSGESSFFDSVAKLGASDLRVFLPEDPYEYWDFGTLDLYKKNIRLLLQDNDSQLKNLLLRAGGFIQEKATISSYSSKQEGVINFTGTQVGELDEGITISLEGPKSKFFTL